MDRRFLIASGFAALGTSACTTTGSRPPPEPAAVGDSSMGPGPGPAKTYSSDEIVNNVSNFLGVTAEAATNLRKRAAVFSGGVRRPVIHQELAVHPEPHSVIRLGVEGIGFGVARFYFSGPTRREG